MKFIAKLVNGSGTINVVFDNGQSLTVNQSHLNYKKLRQACIDNDADMFMSMYNVKEGVKEYIKDVNAEGESTVELKDGQIYYKGFVLHNVITERAINMMSQGFPVDHLILFIENLMKNPSKHSVEQLYNFLEHRNLPITDDGCFLAYKAVTSDYLDKYSKTIDNSVGQVVEVERNEVDDNPNKHCSDGLHCGALDYSGPDGWYYREGDKIVIVKINPKDAVSVPNDASCQKLRVCKYEVVGEYVNPLEETVYSEDMTPLISDYEDDSLNADLISKEGWFIDVDRVLVGDVISFTYHNNYDFSTKHNRSIEVDHIDGNHILGILLPEDPSYDATVNENHPQYREFIIYNMSDIFLRKTC